MPEPTSPETSTDLVKADAEQKPTERDGVQFTHLWANTDGTKQSALAGLVVDQPELRDATLTHDEWKTALDEYLASPRP